MRENKKCGNCAYWKQGGTLCPFFKVNTPEDEHCPMFRTTLINCNLCGNIVPKLPILEIIGNQTFEFCDNCMKYSGLCPTCTFGQFCAFEQDASVKEPPYITQTFRQGNTVIQQQTKNPARIEATCKKCKCFDAEYNSCLRDFNCCGNWSFILLQGENNNA